MFNLKCLIIFIWPNLSTATKTDESKQSNRVPTAHYSELGKELSRRQRKRQEEKVNVWLQLALPQVNASRIYESFSGQLCLSGPLLGSSGCPWKMCVPEHEEEVRGCVSKAGTTHPPAPQLQSPQLLVLKFEQKNEKLAHK